MFLSLQAVQEETFLDLVVPEDENFYDLALVDVIGRYSVTARNSLIF
jgi:hypothetical protein